jgi:peptide/nickel transport system substrate-binding protein
MSDGLLTRDAAMKIQPELVESYTQVDPTTWEFKIRKDVKFHDGSPMTVEDIKFTFDRLTKDGAMGSRPARARNLGP